MNPHDPHVTEKTLTKENTVGIEIPLSTVNAAASPQAIPAPVDASVDAPVVLSQAPPIAPSDAKPVVDKPSKIVASTLGEMK
jgi:hypothetical protein